MPKTSGHTRLMQVLQLVGEEPQGVSVTNIAQALGMSMGSASRLMASLVRAGFIERDVSRRHFISIKLWSLGVRSLQHLRISDMARPLLYESARSSGIPIFLAVVREGNAHLLEQVTAPHGNAMSVPMANVIPHYASAPGKAILAYAGKADTDRIFRTPLTAFTKHTITARDAWDAAMAEVRERGFALNAGEFWEDTLGIAFPVFDQSGAAVASVGNSTSRAEFDEQYVGRAVTVLQSLASRLSSSLGFAPKSF